jgi:hypothetical protein
VALVLANVVLEGCEMTDKEITRLVLAAKVQAMSDLVVKTDLDHKGNLIFWGANGQQLATAFVRELQFVVPKNHTWEIFAKSTLKLEEYTVEIK